MPAVEATANGLSDVGQTARPKNQNMNQLPPEERSALIAMARSLASDQQARLVTRVTARGLPGLISGQSSTPPVWISAG